MQHQTPPQRRYLPFSQHLRDLFGERVHKIGIDAGFTCPNLDGTRGTGGCIYCYGERATQHLADAADIKAQIARSKAPLMKRYKAHKFMAYFQPFTNTYAPPDVLDALYRAALEEEGMVGLAVGTRPDCVDEPVLDVFEALAQQYYVWIEYGLQSMHDRTLAKIHRRHTVADFLDAVTRTTRRSGIRICAHVILGLPGESRDDMLATARQLTELGIDGVKIHSAHVVKDTPLETLYRAGRYRPPAFEEYIPLICDFLEHLAPDIVIQRLVGDSPMRRYVAPEWCLDKPKVLEAIDGELERRNSRQGSRCKEL